MNIELARAQALLNAPKPNPEKAIKTLNPLLKGNRANWMVHHFMGIALLQKKEYQKASISFKKALKKDGHSAETHHLLSVALFQQGELNEAERHEKTALELNDSLFEGWLNLGAIYRSQARLEEALNCYQQANQLDPKHAGVAYRIASIYKDQGDLNKADELFSIVLKLDPDYVEAYAERAIIFGQKTEYDEAEKQLQTMLERAPDHLGGKVELAEVYKRKGDYERAIGLYETLLSDQPNHAILLVNYALSLLEVGRFSESEANYLKALRINPDLKETYSNYLMGLHYNPKHSRSHIFEEHLKWDELFALKHATDRPVPSNKEPNKRLRIGFISGGFRRHPVGWMITSALEQLPDEEIEVFGYTTNSIVDTLTRRISEKCTKWTSVLGYSDQVIADLIRKDEIDILVELSGHSADNRLTMVTHNPVPITVKWVGGLFNTTGLESIDYLITDWQETPNGEEEFYTEKLVRMPDDYICFLPPDYAPETGELPFKENGYITFGCFNNPTKLNDTLLEQWADIMGQVPNSRLMLKSKQYNSEIFRQSVIQRFTALGIEEERVLFEGESAHDVLLAAYNKVDIALDPRPYSGGLTTCEALWMGVPVITYPGETFAGKHAATHLKTAGFEDWIQNDWEGYVNKVVELAHNPEQLANYRSTLREAVQQSPLVDAERFGRHLANAFRAMWLQWIEGKEQHSSTWAQPIDVSSLESFNLSFEPVSEAIAQPKDPSEQGVSLTKSDKNALLVETETGTRALLPDHPDSLTTYVWKEQHRWLDWEVNLLPELLKEGDQMIDIGAGFGAYALEAASLVGEGGSVIAFEPGRKASSYLERSKVENGFQNLTIYTKGVQHISGRLPFKEEQNTEQSRIHRDGKEVISTTTLDQWWLFENEPDIQLLKVDVSGDEHLVIQGAQDVLSCSRPSLILNYSGSVEQRNQIVELLKPHEYFMYEYVPKLHVLVDVEPDLEPDTRQTHLVALQANVVQDMRKNGLIFEDSISVNASEENVWLTYLSEQDWTEPYRQEWAQTKWEETELHYLRALNEICVAETSLESSSVRAQRYLMAIHPVMELYQSNPNHAAVGLSLSRALLALNKKTLAIQVLKTLIEQVSGGTLSGLDLPFIFPIPGQGARSPQTAIEPLVRLRILEAWVHVANDSTYFANEQTLRLLSGMDGNPAALPQTQRAADLKCSKTQAEPASEPQGKFVHLAFNHVYGTSISDMVEHLNKTTNQRHVAYIEKHRAIDDYDSEIAGNYYSTYFDCTRQLDVVIQQCLEPDVDGVIVHGIFFDWQKKAIRQIGNQKHIAWYIWGGDLYNPIKHRAPIKDTVKYVDSVHSIIEKDYEVFEQTYGEKEHVPLGYPYPALYGELPSVDPSAKAPRIIIGNSGDVSNDHLEILQILAGKRDISRYELILPMAYNLHAQYEERIRSYLKETNLDHQTQIRKEFVSPRAYVQEMNRSSMFIAAHKRQQAVGNLLTSMYCGNQTILRKEYELYDEMTTNPTWEFIYENGLSALSFQAFKECTSLSDLPVVSAEQTEAHQKSIREHFGIERRAGDLAEYCTKLVGKSTSTNQISKAS
ncbi:MAG: TDP-N-acetylfucosamine:lipid II N-acetylfucosaminyltransferase [Bacteroidota bacterium]